jgi:iron-sulfur cluster insertion protein
LGYHCALRDESPDSPRPVVGPALNFLEMNMNAMTETQDPLNFTDSAANKVKQLIEEEGNAELKLRVFVSGGGCSGFQYGFTFDEVMNEDDTVMSKNGVQLLIDPMSFQYLVGAEIDYQEGLEGAQFVIKNPNATTTCGCGSSFSV